MKNTDQAAMKNMAYTENNQFHRNTFSGGMYLLCKKNVGNTERLKYEWVGFF